MYGLTGLIAYLAAGWLECLKSVHQWIKQSNSQTFKPLSFTEKIKIINLNN